MERIDGQKSGFRLLAKKVLSWITCAKRPFTTSELQHALAVNISDRNLDKENLREIDDMVSVCAGLVTVDEETRIIRLIHYTTQEYFERTQEKWFPNAETDITAICVTYLSFDAFETGFCPTDLEFEARLQSNALYDYSARNWGHHARTASMEKQLILDFLKSEAKVSASTQAMMADAGYYGYSQRVPRHMMGVHLAAYFGLEEAILTLLKNRCDPNVKDNYGHTPLLWAARNGHKAVVKQLLDTGKVDADSKDQHGQTPLLWAARNGHEAVVKLLLATNGVDPNSKDSNGWVLRVVARNLPLYVIDRLFDLLLQLPLVLVLLSLLPPLLPLLLLPLWLPLRPLWLLLRLLLLLPLLARKGFDPDSWAAKYARGAGVELLRATKGVKGIPGDDDHGTPLSWAARNGHEAVAKLLIAMEGVDPNSKDSDRWAPLRLAIRNLCKRVFNQLLPLLLPLLPLLPLLLQLATSGIDPNSKDSDRWTPLRVAAKNWGELVLTLLLALPMLLTQQLEAAYAIGLDPEDRNGWTPLSWAAKNGHEAVVKLLLATDNIDPDSKDEDGRTPLWFAAENGHEAVIKLLLATESVDVNSMAIDFFFSGTPLLLATKNGHEAVVKLLLEKDTELKSKVNNSLLEYALSLARNLAP
jgi:ankyrin repeat protein